MDVSSPAFDRNGMIPAKYTCDGQGTNPPLRITGVPGAAKTLALIVVDPDVARSLKADGRYLHWALWNLPPTQSVVAEGSGGGISENGAGWIPACPPGEHRYVFEAFALDTSLRDARFSGEVELRQAMKGHVINQAELVGRYAKGAPKLSFILPGILVLAAIALAYRLVFARRSS